MTSFTQTITLFDYDFPAGDDQNDKNRLEHLLFVSQVHMNVFAEATLPVTRKRKPAEPKKA